MVFRKYLRGLLNILQKYTNTDIAYLIQGGGWWALGRFLGNLASFLTLLFFAHFATKEVYGAYQYVLSISAIVAILWLPGIDLALVNAIAKKHEKTYFICEKEKLKFGMYGFLILLGISSWYFLHKNISLGFAFLIAGIGTPILAVFNLYSSVWHGRKRLDVQNKYYIFHNFLGSLIFIAFIYLLPKTSWVVFGYFFGFSISTFIFWKITRNNIEKNTEEEKEAISFGKHLTIMGIPGIISTQWDNILIWQFFGPQILSIYAYAFKLATKVQELIPFWALAIPKIASRNLKDIKRAIFEKFLKLFPFAIIFYAIFFLLTPYVFRILFPSYSEAIFYTQILGALILLSPFQLIVAVFLAGMMNRELYIINFSSQILKILLFCILIPLFGIWGAISSIFISQVLNSLLSLYFFSKI